MGTINLHFSSHIFKKLVVSECYKPTLNVKYKWRKNIQDRKKKSSKICSNCFFQLSVKNCFIRGSVVRYVQLPADECDTQLLQDAARKEAAQNRQR